MPIYNSYGSIDSQIIQQGDRYYQSFNTRLRPDTLPEGVLAASRNGRMGEDGAWSERQGVLYKTGAISASAEALVLPFYLYANVAISAASRVNETVTITTSTSHNFNTLTQVAILDISGTVDPTGNRTITVTGSDTFTFTISGATGSETYTLGSSPIAGAPILATGNAAYGYCRFSPPSQTENEYVIVAESNQAFAYLNGEGSGTAIAYPAGITLSDDVEMLQVFDKVIIFRDGATALEWDGDLSGSPAFTKVANGAYAQPTYYNASNNTVISDGVVTVSETAHGLSVGDRIYVVDPGTSSLTVNDGGYVVAIVPSVDTFKFYAEVEDMASHSVVFTKKVSTGLGFTHMPAPPWGVYHQRRLITPFFYTTTGSSGSEVITNRNIRDEIVISDILDSDTYDVLQASLRVTAGVADFLQTVHPFTDDQAIIFCRNSIHLMTGLSGAINDIQIKEITRETGLVARKSVQTIGNMVYFLSDNGVYALAFEDLYNLRGAVLPLTAPIDPDFQACNPDALKNAVSAYWNNRYFIALPSANSSVNDQMFVYNLLNEGWESIDTYAAPNFSIKGLFRLGSGTKDVLIAITPFGGVHEIDNGYFGSDYTPVAGLSALYDIESYLITRGFKLGAVGRKRFTEFEAEIVGPSSENMVFSYIARNPDSEGEMGTLNDYYGALLPSGEDAIVNGRIGGVRADSIQIKIEPVSGSPFVRSINVRGISALSSLTTVS